VLQAGHDYGGAIITAAGSAGNVVGLAGWSCDLA
jgi:hypothetical protein